MFPRILLCTLLALTIGVPFLYRAVEAPATPAGPMADAETLVIISPHNDAIRQAFAAGFRQWLGRPVTIEWRSVGGTSETLRYLLAQGTTSGIDLFFGGGAYDHSRAERAGILQPIHCQEVQYPETFGGETWRSAYFLGTALSSFGFCYNADRLQDLGVTQPPRDWRDLANPAFALTLGIADPTKSGSAAKAMEMIIQNECMHYCLQTYTLEQIRTYESEATRLPAEYEACVTRGLWVGLACLQRLGANARYFTDSAGSVPRDCAQGVVAAGLVIDFFAKTQAETAPTLHFVLPPGASYSADPISILQNAPHLTLAQDFIRYTLTEGQSTWRRLGRCPINPCTLQETTPYIPRWTAHNIDHIRLLFRAMCMDTRDELLAVHNLPATGVAMFPEELTANHPFNADISTPQRRHDSLQRWTTAFRQHYQTLNAIK